MAISDVIRVGDKIDIRFARQDEKQDKKGDAPELYRSQVFEVKGNGNLEIAMPSEKGKLVLLPLGVRFEFTFYNKGGVYKSIGRVVERYKKGNYFMLEIELKTRLEKFQRREFFRHTCAKEITFYVLDEEQRKMETANAVYRDLIDGDHDAILCHGVMVDLSGGGMKLRSRQKMDTSEKILVMLHLINDAMDRQFYVLGRIIDCREIPTSSVTLYESRVQFKIEDDKIREEIIRYIFEEERKIRRKGNG